MKRIITTLLLLLACSIVSMAETLTAQQKQDILAQINKSVSALKSMTCSFTQTKYLSLLSDKMESSGRMYYKQPNKLRWEYISPYQYLFVFNETKVYVGNKTRKDVIDTNTNKVFKEVVRIMMSTITGTALSNATDFDFDVVSDGGQWQITLLPKKKEMRKMFSKIVLSFGKSTQMISEVTIYEKNNDRTKIRFKDISTNSAIDETLFVIAR